MSLIACKTVCSLFELFKIRQKRFVSNAFNSRTSVSTSIYNDLVKIALSSSGNVFFPISASALPGLLQPAQSLM